MNASGTSWRLALSQVSPLPGVDVAAGLVVQWLAPFDDPENRLAVRPFATLHQEHLSVDTAEDLVRRARTPRKARPTWTHCLLVGSVSRPPHGMLWLRIGDEVPGVPGAALFLDLEREAVARLEEQFRAAVAGGNVSEGSLGPAALAEGHVNVLTFSKTSALSLPPGARSATAGAGVSIRACALTADEAEMRVAIASVARALAATPEALRPAAKQAALRVEPAAPGPVSAHPPSPAVNPDETALIPALVITTPAVPFSGTTSPETLAQMFDSVEPRQRSTEPGPDETAIVPIAAFVMPKTGTFRDQLGALVVPVLSIDEYAELRARLTVYGESHEPTLTHFGVAAREVHEAVRGRFSEYFLRDPSAQAQFLRSMQAAIGRVRAERGATEK